MNRRSFISKVYLQACEDFLQRYSVIEWDSQADEKEKLIEIVNIVKNMTESELKWFDFWYLE